MRTKKEVISIHWCLNWVAICRRYYAVHLYHYYNPSSSHVSTECRYHMSLKKIFRFILNLSTFHTASIYV
jgi:hypothetical protein